MSFLTDLRGMSEAAVSQLTDRQKASLREIYQLYRRESERDQAAPSTPKPVSDPTPPRVPDPGAHHEGDHHVVSH